MDYDEGTAYDMGISTIQRMNYELWHCNQSRREHNITSWYTSLLNLYAELHAFVRNSDDLDKLNESYRQAEKEYSLMTKKQQNYTMFAVKTTKAVPPPPTRKTFDLFIDWELLMRKQMERYGLLMKKVEDAATTITRMG